MVYLIYLPNCLLANAPAVIIYPKAFSPVSTCWSSCRDDLWTDQSAGRPRGYALLYSLQMGPAKIEFKILNSVERKFCFFAQQSFILLVQNYRNLRLFALVFFLGIKSNPWPWFRCSHYMVPFLTIYKILGTEFHVMSLDSSQTLSFSDSEATYRCRISWGT